MWQIFVVFFIFQTSAAPVDPSGSDSACHACDFLVNTLHNLWGEKTLENCVGELVTAVCTTFKIEDHFICKGIIGDFKEEFMWITGELIVEPNQICGLLFPDCGSVFNPLNQTWSLKLPEGKPKPVDPILPKKGSPTMKVLHLSDLHIDMLYTPGLEVKCSEPQCCRPLQNPDELTLGSPAPMKDAAGYWGSVGNCDAPYYLLTNMLEHIQKSQDDIDYIVVSGDLMSHADWDYTHQSHAAMVRNISNTIRGHFPKTSVYFAVGNHEGVPIDNYNQPNDLWVNGLRQLPTDMASLCFAPHFAPAQFNMSWLYDAMADSWKGWVPEDQTEMVKFNGCFMKKLFPGLRILSLNNGLGDKMNFYLYVNETDPDGTMSWFIDQLHQAELAGDKVHVVAHIPGGSGEALEGWAATYYDAFNRFENTIVAQFFGHTHSEEFYVMYEDRHNALSRPTGVIYSAPSVTTYSEYNPAYRVYTVDGNYKGSSYQVLDWEEWFFDIAKNNKDPSNAQWEVHYKSVLDEYGLKNAFPLEWSNFINRMKTDDDLFNKYRENYYRRNDLGKCDQECKNGFLCSARKAAHSDALCADILKEQEIKEASGYTNNFNKKVKTVTPRRMTETEILEYIHNGQYDDNCRL